MSVSIQIEEEWCWDSKAKAMANGLQNTMTDPFHISFHR